MLKVIFFDNKNSKNNGLVRMMSFEEISKACKIIKPFTDFVNELFYGENE